MQIFCLGVDAGSEYETLLGHRSFDKEVGIELASAPAGDQFENLPTLVNSAFGAVGRSVDRVFVRSHSGVICSIEQTEQSIVILTEESEFAAISDVVVDEFCPLAMDLQNHLCVHAALLIAPSGKGFLFLGDSGVGKSTAALLATQMLGWQVAGDDAVVLSFEQQQIVAVASYPGIKVDENSFNLFKPVNLPAEWEELPNAKNEYKHRISPYALPMLAKFFHYEPAQLQAIVALCPSRHEINFTIEQEKSSDSVGRLLWNAFSVPLLGEGREVRRFEQVVNVVNHTDVLIASYAKTGKSIIKLMKFLERTYAY